MNTVARIAKNTLCLAIAHIVTMALGLFFVAVLARFLGDAGFGKYSFALTFMGLVVMFADLGLCHMAIREVARDKRIAEKYKGHIMNKKTVWDIYWKSMEKISVKDIIQSDSYYRLLVRLIGIPNKKGITILEVGCGSGIRTLALVKQFHKNFSNATMIDISTDALEFAKRNADVNGIRANLALADAFNLPFPSESFDLVWNEGVNEHFEGERRQLIFNEMARVCKRGGGVIVIVPNVLNLFYKLWKKVLESQGCWEYGFEKPYSILELRKRMRNAGLAPAKISGVNILTSLLILRTAKSPKKPMVNRDRNGKKNSGASIKILKVFFNSIEKALEKACGSFLGKEIGIKGVKCG